jgi:hypothetical protein
MWLGFEVKQIFEMSVCNYWETVHRGQRYLLERTVIHIFHHHCCCLPCDKGRQLKELDFLNPEIIWSLMQCLQTNLSIFSPGPVVVTSRETKENDKQVLLKEVSG